MKRVNFNMPSDCHALLKSVCALKGVTVSEYVHKIIQEDFHKRARTDKQVQTMFLSGHYEEGSDAFLFKQTLLEELRQSNDDTA